MLSIFYVLSILFSLIVSHPIQDSDDSTKCTFLGVSTGYIPVGKTVSIPGECTQITCHEDLSISGLTCPTYVHTFDCRLSETDYYKDFPDCCPQIICAFDEFRVN